MNVFCDLHHGALFYSLQLLFEKRLGWKLFRPIGLDWFRSGFWNIADSYPDSLDTAKQYLGTDDKVWNQYRNLNGDYQVKDGIYYVFDPVNEIHQKAITLEQFKEMQIDIVISSIQAHDISYANLIKEHKPNAKHIAQMGNFYQQTDIKNVMCSTAPFPIREGQNVVFYHQEFPLDIFKPITPDHNHKITSFINVLPRPDLFNEYKGALPDYEFKAFGASCPDGTITGLKNIAAIMGNSSFGWHVKPGGDGFGHIIHNWFACGRPVITNGSDYFDKLAGVLLEDGVTCIDLEQGNFQQNIDKIKFWNEPDNHIKMCQNAFKRFEEVVNYDEEEKEVRNFLDNLL